MGDTRLTSVGTTLCVAAEQDPDIFPPGYRETRELVYADFSQNEWGMLATGGWDLPFSIVAHPDRAGTALVLTGTLAPNTYASSGVRIDERDLADHSASPPLDAARYTLGDDPFPDPSARPIRPAALAIDR